MKFEFDTTADGPAEAGALVAALSLIYGGSILEHIDRAADRLEGTEPTLAPEFFNAPMPAGEEPSAAAAFGGEQPTEYAPGTEGVELDKFGIPWDARIHSGSKGTNKDGSWSRRRNTSDEDFDRVMAELKGEAPLQVAPPPPPPAPAAETVTPPPPPPPAPAAGTVVPPPPATSTADASTTSDEPITFPKFMVKVTKLQTSGSIDMAKVDEFLAMFELTGMSQLNSAGADTLAAINAMVDSYVGA